MRKLWHGLIAGAAGTLALNAVTYVDMALRGRPASSAPEESVERATRAAGLDLGDKDKAANRRAGLGPLLGLATGVGTAITYATTPKSQALPVPVGALLLTGMAMTGSNGPMALLGITDPRTWDREAWLSDLIPHLVYGLVTAKTYAVLSRR